MQRAAQCNAADVPRAQWRENRVGTPIFLFSSSRAPASSPPHSLTSFFTELHHPTDSRVLSLSRVVRCQLVLSLIRSSLSPSRARSLARSPSCASFSLFDNPPFFPLARRVCSRELTNSATDFYYGKIRLFPSLSLSLLPSLRLGPHPLGYNRFEATAISDMRESKRIDSIRAITLFSSPSYGGRNKLASSPRRDFPE